MRGYTDGGMVGDDPSPIPGADVAPANYQVEPGSPFDRALAAMPTATPNPGRDTLSQLIAAQNARAADPFNTLLRNREHELFSQHVMNTYGPVLGRAIVGAAVPTYAAAKAGAQALPSPIGHAIDRVSPFPLAGATKPDMGEVAAGLKPAFGDLPSLLKFLGVAQ